MKEQNYFFIIFTLTIDVSEHPWSGWGEDSQPRGRGIETRF